MKIHHARPAESGTYTITALVKNRELTLLLPSPLDVQTRIMQIPPLREEHIEGSVRIMLRSIHPGNPDDLAMDFEYPANNPETIKHSGGSIAVYSTTRQTLETLHAMAHPVIPGISLLASLAGHSTCQNEIGMLVSPQWTEIIQFDNGIPVASIAVHGPLSGKPEKLICEHFRIPDLSDTAIFTILMEPDLEPPLLAKHETCFDHHVYHVNSLPEQCTISDRYAKGLFTGKKKSNTRRFRAPAIFLAVLNLVMLFGFLEYRIHERNARLDSLKQEYSVLQKTGVEIQRLEKELERLTTEKTASARQTDPDPYAVLSAMSPCLSGTWIQTFTLNGHSFQITAETPDALKVLSALAGSESFTNVTLLQSTPHDNGREFFTISGEVPHDSK